MAPEAIAAAQADFATTQSVGQRRMAALHGGDSDGDGGEIIAANSHCPVAGLAVGERAWTLQGHPEFVPSMADHLLAGRVELIGAERVATARASLTRPLDRITVGQWIARFFAG